MSADKDKKKIKNAMLEIKTQEAHLHDILNETPQQLRIIVEVTLGADDIKRIIQKAKQIGVVG